VKFFLAPWVIVLAALSAGTQARAEATPTAEDWLPATTKAFFAVADVADLERRWDSTQFGKLAQHEQMKPFIEDLQRQIRERVTRTRVRLGLEWSDLKAAASGEAVMAAIQPEGKPGEHALAVIVDVTGRADKTTELLAKIHTNLTKQRAQKSTKMVNGAELIIYSIPREEGEPQQAAVFRAKQGKREYLIAVDHLAEATNLLARLERKKTDSLAGVEAFRQVRQRFAESHPNAHVRWFVEPFGYAEVMRASSDRNRKRGADMLKVLRTAGFDGIAGAGGHLFVAEEGRDFTHHTLIVAPKILQLIKDRQAPAETGNANKIAEARRQLRSAGMLDFANTKELAAADWTPDDISTWMRFNWNAREAFYAAKTLVNEMAGGKVFEDVLDGIRDDPKGPRVDLRKNLGDRLGTKATFISSYKLEKDQITTKSERILFAIDVTDAKVVAETVRKAMSVDQDAKRRTVAEQEVWEIIRDDSTAAAPKVEISGFNPLGEEDEPEEEDDEPKGLPNSAIVVVHGLPADHPCASLNGHLVVASHVDMLFDILTRSSGSPKFADSDDYRRAMTAIETLGGGQDAFRTIARTDRSFRPNYELMRQGKMPESETMLAKLLNRILGPDKKGPPRKQELDPKKMPQFSAISDFFGLSATYVRTEAAGWRISGALLAPAQGGQAGKSATPHTAAMKTGRKES